MTEPTISVITTTVTKGPSKFVEKRIKKRTMAISHSEYPTRLPILTNRLTEALRETNGSTIKKSYDRIG
jgi:hypothetical protein